MGFYDGTKLLSLLDAEKKKPEIYMCTTNRSAGKTTYFSRLLVNKWKQNKEKFCILYRYSYELDDCANKFFKDIQALFFQNDVMADVSKTRGLYHELYFNDELCGYALAINSAEAYKRNSHLFSDISRIFLDEFQSEQNHYCPMEIEKFQSIHITIARGGGKIVRYVPVYMCSNPVTLLNPYYTAMNISDRLQEKDIYFRGKGFVLEQGFNREAANAQQESAFNRAFSGMNNNQSMAYDKQNIYLHDNKIFIEQPKGRCQYLSTISYMGQEFGVKAYLDSGYIYCDTKPDKSHKNKICTTTDDMRINYVMLARNDMFLLQLRNFFTKGCFRFQNLRCKEAVIKTLSL